MTEFILWLNPHFGGPWLGLGDAPDAATMHRVGPDYPDDANCNKVIFAILAMTLYRALAGVVLNFFFELWRTCACKIHRARGGRGDEKPRSHQPPHRTRTGHGEAFKSRMLAVAVAL